MSKARDPNHSTLFGVQAHTCRRTPAEAVTLPIFSICAKIHRLNLQKHLQIMNTHEIHAHFARTILVCPLRTGDPSSTPEEAKTRRDPGKTGKRGNPAQMVTCRCSTCSAHTSCRRMSSSTRFVPGVEKKSVFSVTTILPGSPPDINSTPLVEHDGPIQPENKTRTFWE